MWAEKEMTSWLEIVRIERDKNSVKMVTILSINADLERAEWYSKFVVWFQKVFEGV
jgi:hypothetical protein